MSIDIRDDQQLECIICALCIDACNGVMEKIELERGLISYATLREYNANMAVATGDENVTSIKADRVCDSSGKLSSKIVHTNWRSIARISCICY